MSTEFGTGQATGDAGDAVAMDATREAMAAISADEPDFCQVFCSPAYDYEAVLWGARSVIGSEAEIVGCSSSGEFTEAGAGDGTVTVGVVSSDSLQFFSSISTKLSADPERCLFEAVHDLPSDTDPAVDGYPHRTVINLHDGMAGIGNKVTKLTEQYLDGEDTTVVGGSAGDDLQLQQTHVFRNGRVETDAVVLVLIASEEPLPVTVNHGHEPISEAMTVTRADGSTVYELDGRPAFEAWRDAIREDAMETYGIDVDELEAGSDDLVMLLGRYELGIESEPETESGGLTSRIKSFIERKLISTKGYNIRWPGQTTDTQGPLDFAVTVSEGTELRVTHSNKPDQVSAVRTAAENATSELDGGAAGGFVYDCACRAMILGDDFDEAVDAIQDTVDAPFAGFETYGEVCSADDDYTGYHNTASVILLFPE
ncbi:FIST signal transduction protein [Haloarcula amylolytica]|uniref:FIST signal transduction protein n=1 Tax=Haloarcula amylolytica TaxID=396317 RepID=UPI003C73648D